MSKRIDQIDVDALVDLHSDNEGKTDEQLAALSNKYLKSNARKYRRAKDGQKRPVLTVLDGGRVD
jgi:hypothetical protein